LVETVYYYLWLNTIESYRFRAFEFIACFLHEFGTGDKTLADAIGKAYAQSLRRYHGMLARNIFSVNENTIVDLFEIDFYIF